MTERSTRSAPPPLAGDQLVELEIPARADYLALARLIVAAAADLDPTFAAERIDALRLAVSEAVTNAIRAHERMGRDDRVVVRCNLGEDRIDVEVRDYGGGFDPEDASVGTAIGPELHREGGYGLPLIRSVADESRFLAGPEGTSVRLVVFTTRRS